ncbi:MAG: hypothetical protein IPK00_04105 [Deltaproteobacteria bacterium]|nr:hypothetical protein [Deltaproteobacteria bacterium]
MLYPDPKQRTVLGWQIRWVAGLVTLLMVAAGAMPAFAADDTAETLFGSGRGVLHASAGDERATSGKLVAVTSELLGGQSGSESEGEVEVEENDLDPSCSPTAYEFSFPCLPIRDPQLGNRSPRSTEAGCRLAPRAPPLA